MTNQTIAAIATRTGKTRLRIGSASDKPVEPNKFSGAFSTGAPVVCCVPVALAGAAPGPWRRDTGRHARPVPARTRGAGCRLDGGRPPQDSGVGAAAFSGGGVHEHPDRGDRTGPRLPMEQRLGGL